MESRFRRFLNSRRDQVPRSPTENIHSIPYGEASHEGRQPIFVYQPLGKSASEQRKNLTTDVLPLASLPYDCTSIGKTPMIGGRPHKGNGPVKLQTSRRLSSGDLFVTTQDSERTLQDIREGDYIVGKKDKRLSQSYGHGHGSSTVRSSQISTAMSAPPTSYNNSSRAITPPDIKIGRNSTSTNNYEPLNTKSRHPKELPRLNTVPQDAAVANTGLHSPSLGGNATIQALRKAEYGRLVKLYGQDGVDRNIAVIDRENLNKSSPSSPNPATQPNLLLEPLPMPPTELKNPDSRPGSGLSGALDAGYESSDHSSHRQPSTSSTNADSSAHTTQTNLSEHDPNITRDDIRRMVDQLRSTYISALDTRPPTAIKKKSKSKRRRTAKPKELPSIASTENMTASPVPSEDVAVVQNDDNARLGPNARRPSQPTSTTGRLSPIQASPSRKRDEASQVEKEPEIGLKRADSTTLGNMFPDSEPSSETRKAHRKSTSTGRRTTAGSDRPITPSPNAMPPSSWVYLDFDSTDEALVESAPKVPKFPELSPPPVSSPKVVQRPPPSPATKSFGNVYHDMFYAAPVTVPQRSHLPPRADSLHPPPPKGPPPPLPVIRQHS